MINLEITEVVQVINLTVIDQTVTTDFEITEVVETIHLTVTEKFGSDGQPGEPGKDSTVPGPPGPPGTSILNTSELINDGDDGINPFISAEDIADKADSDASNIDDHIAAWRTKLGVGTTTPDSFQIGEVTTTPNSVNIAVFEVAGTPTENFAIIDDVKRAKTIPDLFSFTPVTAGKLKSIIIHARPDAQIFYKAEGLEGTEAQTPDFDGLFVMEITVTDAGAVINTGSGLGNKYQSDDNWRTVVINTNAGQFLSMGNNRGSTFELFVSAGVTTPKINGIITKPGQFGWNGKPWKLYNNSAVDIVLEPASTLPVVTGGEVFNFEVGTSYVLKPKSFVDIVRKGADIMVIEVGESFDPTSLQSQIDAEIVTRAIEDNKKLDKPLTPNNTNQKVILGDNSVKGLETFQVGDQIEVTLPAIVLSGWNGKVVIFTNTGTLTIPTGLPDSWSFNGATLAGVTLSLSLTSPKTWLFGTPTSITEKQIFTIAQRGVTNSTMLFGV